jgi:hypothetical protein
MFDFVRLVARAFIRTRKTMPPKIVGTPSLLAAFRGAEYFDQIVNRSCRRSKHALAEERECQIDTIEDIAVLGGLLVFSSLPLALIVLMYCRAISVLV